MEGIRRRGVQTMLLVLALQLWASAPLGAQAVIATVDVDNAPGAVAVNERTDRIYVANEFSGTVSVIEGATNFVGTVAVDALPRAVAVNERTNRIYVANGSGATVSVIQD